MEGRAGLSRAGLSRAGLSSSKDWGTGLSKAGCKIVRARCTQVYHMIITRAWEYRTSSEGGVMLLPDPAHVV